MPRVFQSIAEAAVPPAADKIGPRPVHINLKQRRMLHAVIDCGGFAEAAKFLHISQSTISYSITNMQEQLGTALLRTEGRKARLTEEGRALLNRSRELLRDAIELEDFAIRLGRGWNSEIRVAIDPVLPITLLLDALRNADALSA